MQCVFDFLSEQSAKRKLKDRLFFALFPGLDAGLDSDGIGQGLKKEYAITAPLLPVARRHVSLQHVGDYRRLKSKHVFAACKAAATIVAQPFTIALDHVKTFPGRLAAGRRSARHPCVLCCRETDPLFDLYRKLGLAMLRIGLKPGFDFVPHMTLFYGPVVIPVRKIRPIDFKVTEFFLVHSEVGLSRYHILGKWPLCG